MFKLYEKLQNVKAALKKLNSEQLFCQINEQVKQVQEQLTALQAQINSGGPVPDE